METRQQDQDQGPPYCPIKESDNLPGEDFSQTVLNWNNLGENPATSQGEWGETSQIGKEGSHSPLPAQETEWGPKDWVTATTWDMQLDSTGLLDSEPFREADEDLVSEVNLNSPIMTEEEREEIQQELTRLEEEINTLKQVLASKEKQHFELKQKLGITPLGELKNNFTRGWHDMQSSSAYKKTSETLSTAGQKTSAAFSTLGTAISRKFGDMSMVGLELLYPRRSNSIGNSPGFRSFEEKVETTVSTIKTKVGGTGNGGSFEEVLSSTAQASSPDAATGSLTDTPERSC